MGKKTNSKIFFLSLNVQIIKFLEASKKLIYLVLYEMSRENGDEYHIYLEVNFM